MELTEVIVPETFTVPAVPSKTASLSPAQLQQQVLAEFRGEIPPVETPLAYRLGIVLVSFVMVLLPLVYIGIIALRDLVPHVLKGRGYGLYLRLVKAAPEG